jgi:hypothetical protein
MRLRKCKRSQCAENQNEAGNFGDVIDALVDKKK